MNRVVPRVKMNAHYIRSKNIDNINVGEIDDLISYLRLRIYYLHMKFCYKAKTKLALS